MTRRALAGLTVLAGCHGPRAPARPAGADGVSVVSLPRLDQVAFPAWTTRPLFSTVGDSVQLGPNAQAAFTVDSNLWLAAGPEILVLDLRGRLLRRIGRSGAGPGEFRSVFQLVIAADGSVGATDFGTFRLSQFGTDGRLLRTVARLGRSADPGVALVSILGDGRFLVTDWQQRPNRVAAPGSRVGAVSRDSGRLTVLDSAGVPSETLGVWRGLERARVDLGTEPSQMVVPFARTVVADGRNGWTAIGSTDSLDVSLFDGTRPVLRLTAPATGLRPTASQGAAWTRALRAEQPDVADGYLAAIAEAPRGQPLPEVGCLVVDAAGNLWVGGYATPGDSVRVWQVFDSSGRPIGRLDLPALMPVLVPGSCELLDVAGDRLALRVATDGGDFVEVRRIVRP